MSARIQVAAGVALVIVSLVGLLVATRRFDRGAISRTVPVDASAWRIASHGDEPELSLGLLEVPAAGALRIVVCPARPLDPHVALRVASVAGRVLARTPVTADPSRDGRCFEAKYSSDAAQRVRVALVAPARGGTPTFREVELQASRRITPPSMWPGLVMLLGFVIVARAPRAGPQAAPLATAEVPPVVGLADADAAAPSVVRLPAPVDWPWSLAFVIVGYLLLQAMVVLVASVYLAAAGQRALTTGVFYAVTAVVQHGFMAVMAAWFLGAFSAADPRAALGLVRTTWRDVAVAVGLGFALVVVAQITARYLIHDISVSPMGQLIERVPVRYALGFAALLAPLSEELFFRGVLVRAFGKLGLRFGVVASAVLFTLVHVTQLNGASAGLIPIALVAVVNGWLRLRSGGITQPWIVHAVYNVVLSSAVFLA